ncbi:hypothetical protein H0H81_000135 [Sphagnurus paluster]|uniref:HSF-type DNA-binding domain-containing protein n=1 Tax=Sphagnurus paluster TaxID=117069 RepID=A0A9P7FQ75_9AGAR|nr:hypothetical protein H0H81_000135 [Sphagnurus paluster]
MATGQVTLARQRAPIPAPKSSRQAVPAFLQKLHEMVNDPNNHELIRWSDAGDSFYVLDHERFAREVLGRWFKHQNFASFVRQLNMYGFHKIPHLQQGVLRSDTDMEFWNFAHANFHRGQPDLLCLIQRKKQTVQPGEEVMMDIRETTNPTPTQANPASGQVVDIHSIVSGIAAIKRHQSTISSELNELKRSNQLLWQDALEARAKHQKQQDTINRILKFLAGVFGSRANPHKDDIVESIPSRAVVPRRHSRFLIEDVRSVKDAEDPKYPVIETPHSIPSPSPSECTSSEPLPETPHDAPMAPASPADSADRSVTPKLDPHMQVFIDHISPAQIQHLLSSIPALDSIQTDPSISNSSQLAQYMPDLFSQFMEQPRSPPPPSIASTDVPAESLLSFDDHQIDLQHGHSSNVTKSWKATEDIERDVNAMNSDIDLFIRGLGLDPHHLETGDSNGASPSTSSLPLEADDVHVDVPSQPPLDTGVNTHAPASGAAEDPLLDLDNLMNAFTATTHLDTGFPADGDAFYGLDPPVLVPVPPSPVVTTAKRKSDVSELAAQISPQTALDAQAPTDTGTAPVVKPPKRRRNK